ncbi:MAG: hypothetical protein FWD80_02500 [Propionibacteriaceae bacterium]|nr:hypothetical protein [Propionibacteriaceae bacterium]
MPAVFSNPVASDLGNGLTRYSFSGTYAANDIAGPQRVSRIVITVQHFDSLARGDVVTMQIPSALLPTNDSLIMIDSQGNPVSMKRVVSRPLQLYYTVAPKPGIADALSDPQSLNTSTSQDGTALAQYIASNLANGQVRFYSNEYSVTTGAGGTPIVNADANATWTPSENNAYYRFSPHTPLFADAQLTTPLTQADWDALSATGTVYYANDIYVYTDSTMTDVIMSHEAVPITKQQLLDAETADLRIFADGQDMYAPTGLPKYSRPLVQDAVKCLDPGWVNGQPACPAAPAGDGNSSDTATMARQYVMSGGTVTSLLGNNGYIGFAIPAELTIAKTVTAAPGFSPSPTQNFVFKVDLRQSSSTGASLTGAFSYAVFSSLDMTTPVSVGTVSSGGTITLTASQKAVISGLPDDTYYSVQEQNLPSGYTATQPGSGVSTGTVAAGEKPLINFVNTYAPASASAAPTVIKQLTGRTWTASDQFGAELCPVGAAPSLGSTPSGCATAAFQQTGTTGQGNARFGPTGGYTFGTPGTYVYTITEDSDTPMGGIEYSAAVYEWIVTVTDNGGGQLQAASAIKQITNDAGETVSTGAVSAATFTNNFAAEDLAVPLTATKLVQDTSTDQSSPPVDSYPFTFSYVGIDGTPGVGNDASVSIPVFGSGADTATVDSVGSAIVSPTITYDQSDVGHVFYFKAKESTSSPAPTGVTYSSTVWFWQVSIDESGGVLQADIASCQTDAVNVTAANVFGTCDPNGGTNPYSTKTDAERVFTNMYEPTAATATMSGVKVLDGRPWMSGDSYTFTISGNDLMTTGALSNGDIVFNAGSTCPGVVVSGSGLTAQQTVSQGTNGQASFCFDATFNKQGAYQFAIIETGHTGAADGMVFDTHAVVYDVIVTDPSVDGLLQADESLQGGRGATAQFTNRYRDTQLYGGIEVSKTLVGRDLNIGEFSFTLKAADAASCAKALLPASTCELTMSNANGSNDTGLITMLPGELNFTQADLGQDFKYTISENQTPALGGVTYDSAVYTADVSPQYDAGANQMWIKTSITDGAGNVHVYDSRDGVMPSVGFTNNYEARPAVATLTFSDSLVGRAWTAADNFKVDIRPASPAAPMPGRASVNVDSQNAGKFDFGTINYDRAGVYQYEVFEESPDGATRGLQYDPLVVLVTVVVTDNGEGQLVAEVSYRGGQDFTNYYQALVTWNPTTTVTLHGRDMGPYDFGFEVIPDNQLSADAANIPLAGATWANTASQNDGVAQLMGSGFPSPTFTQDQAGDTYCYTFKQIIPTAPEVGVTYDSLTYHVCVAVTDQGDGNLVATTTVKASDGTEAKYVNRSDDAPGTSAPVLPFVNYYEPPAASQSTLTLVAVVNSPSSMVNPLAPGDATLTAATNSGVTISGNGTGYAGLGGVENTPVDPDNYFLQASSLDGYTNGSFSCVTVHDADNVVPVSVVNGVVHVPAGASVVCTVIYDAVDEPIPTPSEETPWTIPPPPSVTPTDEPSTTEPAQPSASQTGVSPASSTVQPTSSQPSKSARVSTGGAVQSNAPMVIGFACLLIGLVGVIIFGYVKRNGYSQGFLHKAN